MHFTVGYLATPTGDDGIALASALAKTFGATDGHKFVNGVLDKLAPKLRSAELRAGKR